jgi:uncharacterized protein (DUF2235 family)
LWQPGDRIFLFGFSRGAYTVRCLGGVIAFCGIPTHLKGEQPLKLDLDSTLKLARYAVKHVYQFDLEKVQLYDELRPYRPQTLRVHVDFAGITKRERRFPRAR